MKKIYIGKENATYQQIFALKNNRGKRNQLGLFFVEGVQNIKEAITYGWDIDAFIFSSDKELSDWAKSILSLADKNYILSQQLMNNLSSKDIKSEILALVKKNVQSAIIDNENPVYILLDRPSKKGNMGTIIRSCDALNVSQIFYSGHSIDIYDCEVITASMGSFFKVPITFIDSSNTFNEIIDNIKTNHSELQIIATSLQATCRLQDCDFTKPTLLLIGNETVGLSKFYNDIANQAVKIPMKKGIDSLNVACATTACLYEIQRQRDFF